MSSTHKYLNKLIVVIVVSVLFFGVVYAKAQSADGNTQNNTATTTEFTKAQNTVSEALGVQVLCQEPFLNFKATQDCINLEIGGFLPVLDSIDEGLKNQLTPLKDTNKIFAGPLYNQQELEILPIEINPTPSQKTGCQWNYSVLQVTSKPLANRYTVAFESCGLDISSFQLLEIRNGQPASKLSGKIAIRTLLIPLNQTFYLID
jgi:hypothetical protein